MTAAASSRVVLRVVLLGASGFVGGAVLRQMKALARHGVPCEAHLLVHRAEPAHVPAFARVHRGSLLDLPADLLPNEPHVVIHCASKQIDVDGTGFSVNLRGAENLCDAIRANGLTRAVLYLSSYSVYGEGPQRDVTEAAPLRPETALALSRAACEVRLSRLAKEGLCSVVNLRTRFVLGDGDRHVLPGLAKLARSRLQLGNGQQRYSVIDVDDLARVLLQLARQANEHEDVSSEIYNVAYEQPISLQDIRTALAGLLPARAAWWRVPVSPALWRVVARLRVPKLRQLAHRITLMGLDRYGSVAKLQRRLSGESGGQPGSELLRADPVEVVRRAAQALAQQSH